VEPRNEAKVKRILVLHGPNLAALGTREPAVYGRSTLADIQRSLEALAPGLGCEVECRQSNHEGVLIDALHSAKGTVDGVLLNPGGLTHTSVALRDAVLAAGVPVVEVHISNPHAREPFRHVSFVSGAAVGVVQGFGPAGYELALRGLMGVLSREEART
jgi:3-dehydroquinate dehydratase II